MLGKISGALVVTHFGLPIVREYEADMGRAIDEAREFTRAGHGIKFALRQHPAERLARRDRLKVDISAKL
jgi:hypothetical protein